MTWRKTFQVRTRSNNNSVVMWCQDKEWNPSHSGEGNCSHHYAIPIWLIWERFRNEDDFHHRGKWSTKKLSFNILTLEIWLLILPPQLLHISLKISYENWALHQDYNFYLICLSILTTCLLDKIWVLEGEVAC